MNISQQTLPSMLKTYFGFETFRQGQQEVILQILNGESALAIFPTGSGKSLCYQLSAMQLPYLTLVVSPLLALMKDQLEYLKAHNIPAASLDSTLTSDQYRKVVTDIKANKLKILMVSVERFKNERFRLLMEGAAISLLVVDEAHCISEWGHNFRPDYLKLPHYQKALNIPQTLLLTATATKAVKLDMANKFTIAPSAIIQTGFYRSNLHLQILAVPQNQKNNQLCQLVRQHEHGNGNGNGNGIVYVTLQRTAERVANDLKQAGFNAHAYHAGMKNEERARIQEGFMCGDIPLVVATIAFGMGVDKANIRYVIHYDLPKSIENYSQEIGRAGRDGLASYCYVLGNLDALNTIENFVYGDTPEQSAIAAVLNNIIEQQKNNQWEMQLYQLANESNIRQLTLKTLLVQLEIQGVLTPLYSYSAEYSVKLLCDQTAIVNAFEGERRSFVECVFQHIQFKRTWGIVNFEGIIHALLHTQQGNKPGHYQGNDSGADRKRIITALEYFKEKNWIELKPTGAVEVFSVNPSMINESLIQRLANHFKAHEHSELQRIKAMLNFLQSKECLSYGLAQYFDDQNAPSQCAHCSSCKGQGVTFNAPNIAPLDVTQLNHTAQALAHHLKAKGITSPSRDLMTRFLVGINVPVFTRTKAKVVPGFGVAEAVRYTDVYEALSHISNN